MERKAKTIVRERKLGRNQAVGLAFNEKKDGPLFGEIHIDPRQGSFDYFDTLIHEKLHLMYPSWAEKKIAKDATEMARFLWQNNFRRIHN